jgi:hypothetical protein
MMRNLMRIRKKVKFILCFFILDWKTIISWKNKCALLKLRESWEELDDTLVAGTSTHMNLYILLNEHKVCL